MLREWSLRGRRPLSVGPRFFLLRRAAEQILAPGSPLPVASPRHPLPPPGLRGNDRRTDGLLLLLGCRDCLLGVPFRERCFVFKDGIRTKTEDKMEKARFLERLSVLRSRIRGRGPSFTRTWAGLRKSESPFVRQRNRDKTVF